MSEKRFSDLNDLKAIIEELEQEIDEQQATIKQQSEEILLLKALLENAHRQSEIGRSYVQDYISSNRAIRYTRRIDRVRNELRKVYDNDYLTLYISEVVMNND